MTTVEATAAVGAPPRIMVTGATGFIGRRLALALASSGQAVLAPVRSPQNLPRHSGILPARGVEFDADGNPNIDWRGVLWGIECVVHLAARAHIMKDEVRDPLAEYRRVNVAGTLNLARQAADAGVRRFVFVSSIKVNGEETRAGAPFTAMDTPAPVDAYGVSKLEAEQGLARMCAEAGMELVIIRPVLVYGPGVRANFLSMMRALHRGIPLPLGAIRNRRSLVALDNLVDLVTTCMHHPAAAGLTFLASDGEDMSTPELLRRTAAALGTRARLIPVPEALLRAAGGALGRGAAMRRLCGSLQVDIAATRGVLGWTPPVTVEEGLRQTAKFFLESQRS